ncbi:excinuclease ABC subunit UvrC [Gluconacetobacter entanii]|uniref:excinuclease ABC subunit UvrC n=1 Tax=Gluconacetobacter entanii TaxID=108528 RepID=UPI001C93414A|nr:excinuclease ABC subunit UvrC [Gluconacetobacter entanii]MBY4641248.1 excinuclease ABC subunit UvrC [Gluconacetobacter entanii]MCW4581959.1 excinuclease ABC subunit UvrC [Gluconacetobacter entanii]MCW4585299.1 excinuclease ABC subunit UvrC [Gluconacetobacter entanii]MCW4588876.1 excinuclease ABC subunit UvrC [Gluconacetobacter entanii]
MPADPPPIGVAAIHRALQTMPLSPGVYRMLGRKGEVLYVGKALALKKRVTSYTQVHRLPERLRRMVSETAYMEIVTTHTEAEALLLEANYIKRMQPRYNILLRDDKSYPWIILTDRHEFPQIAKHRGKPVKGASYWGPFASAWSVNQTLNLLQKAFLLRSCTDSVLKSRTRPCLLHQIHRCSAPCVDMISQEDYADLVKQARDFLSGKNPRMHEELVQQMEEAAGALQFERAAAIRDRIRGLSAMQQDASVINPTTMTDADIVAIWQIAGQSCIQVFFIRGGRNNGNRAFFPSHARDEDAADVLAAFLAQFYDDKPPPGQILVNHAISDNELLSSALELRRGRRVEIIHPQRGEKRAVLEHAELNAREALERKLAESAGQARLLQGVADLFGLPEPPRRIETYDNSHIMGTNAYGVMVVAGPEGFEKRAYRKFGIKGPVTPGDDFGMMREVLERRFSRAMRDREEGTRPDDWPDILLIDGGAGQYSAVRAVLDELGVTDVTLVGIAKGIDRDAGREWFHTADRPPFQLPPRDPVLYYLQRLRDEAHRFAITTHRAGRSKTLVKSELDDIPGVGPARKRALLNRFGSARGVRQAGLGELESAPGISRDTARTIYGFFHPEWTGE